MPGSEPAAVEATTVFFETQQGIPVDSDLQKRLRKKAGILLARRAYSRGEMRQKLLEMAEQSLVETVLDRLEELDLLNDRDYAYNFSLYRVGREGWGPGKIRDALQRRHVSDPDIAAALDRVRSLVGDSYALEEYLKRHFAKRSMPEDSRGVRNLVNHLHRRGYGRDTIVDVLKRKLPAEMARHL